MKAIAVGTRVLALTLVILSLCQVVAAQEPQWIWSPSHEKNEVPVGDCYFRKSFDLKTPELGEVQITADNRFELFVNEQSVGRGEDWRKMQVYDISKYLRKGRNCIAVKVSNIDAGSAGLVARVLVKENGNTFVSYSTNKSWKTSVRQYQSWSNPDFPDREWVGAKSYGMLNATLPWGDEVVFAGEGSRFKIGKEFTVERLMADHEVGSLIAMSFDGDGNILASREGGHLLLLTDTDGNGAHDAVEVFCDQIKNVQGILAHQGSVYSIGDGPEGVALYRLRDANRDGTAEEIKALVPIRGSRGEHGAHAVRLGPDGMLYVIIGDHARVGVQPGPQSPYRNAYEGDLVKPRYDDPRGHAVGIPAPGGTVFRTDTEGSFVELVAGGLRNSYDFAFNAAGELFTYDADMEWDMGAPWYRPTRINHVTAGAELGWRSGWAKWPSYYLDSLPAAINLGAGSPTGVEFYYHDAFPERYHGALFGCDWATGKIHCLRFQPGGASYTATNEVFVEGRPLNATDLAVGPDGALYFCTGGRGTDGGVYRIRWTENQSKAQLPSTLEDALAQPQLDAAWSQSQVARVKQALGQKWDLQLPTIAASAKRTVPERLKALDLLVTFGPQPSEALLTQLASDPSVELRTRAARLLFAHRTTSSRDTLVRLLDDKEPFVRRVACETLTRFGSPAPPETFVKLLDDESRFVAFAARRALEQLPLGNWAQQVLEHPSPTVFCRGSAAILATSPSTQAAQAVLPRCEQLLANPPTTESTVASNRLRLDLLRVAQLALELGKIAPQNVPSLGSTLLQYYPSGVDPVDRELVRLLVYLQVPGAAEKFATQMLREDLADPEKIHLGAYAGRLQTGWTPDAKQAFLKFYEVSRAVPGGYSVSAYLENFARDFFAQMTPVEARQIITTGQQWPTSALSLLATLPASPGADLLAELRALDGRIKPMCAKSDTYRRLRVGTLAVLGRSGEPASLAYLRDIYAKEPEQRTTIAMTLAQHPQGDNWAYLVDSIKTVDGIVAQEVLRALTQVAQRPQQPEPFRQVILLGLRLGDSGAPLALQLLDHWSGQSQANQPGQPTTDWQAKLAGWQQWYAKHFPGAPPAELPVDSGTDKWSHDELLAFLRTRSGRAGDRERGEAAFTKADCFKCHRCGGKGETIGPDLTTIAQRFQQQELLESIVYPSHNISDQYASKNVTTNGRTYSGLVVPRGNAGVTVLLSDGQKVDLAHADIDDLRVSSVSVMPTGLLNKLSLSEVADLFAFLSDPSGTQGQVGEMANKQSEAAKR